MPPPSASPALQLIFADKPYFVVQVQEAPADLVSRLLAPSGGLKNIDGPFLSVTRTAEEISIVGEQVGDEYAEYATWSCIKIRGPMEHDLVGVMAAFTAPLKDAKVPVFAISTWNTDFVLVPSSRRDDAFAALKTDGWDIV